MEKSGKVVQYQAENQVDLRQDSSPLVSVVIPTYNRISFIKGALESVYKQNYENLEVIVVDDCSDDGTLDWIKNNYPSVKLVELSERGGPGNARNEGIKLSQGDIIAFLDSDDVWYPNYVQQHVRALTAHPSAVLSFCAGLENKYDGSQSEITYSEDPEYESPLHRLILGLSFIQTMSLVVIKKEAFEKVGLLNITLKRAQDRELYIRLFQLSRDCIFIPEVLMERNLHDDNMGKHLTLWAKSSMQLLDIFFSKAENEGYKYLEKKARAEITVKMICVSFYFKASLLERFSFYAYILGQFIKNLPETGRILCRCL